MNCRRCGGSGKVPVRDPVTGFNYLMTCAACQGTGEDHMKPTKRRRKRLHRDAWRQREMFGGRS